jgi:bacterioferritin
VHVERRLRQFAAGRPGAEAKRGAPADTGADRRPTPAPWKRCNPDPSLRRSDMASMDKPKVVDVLNRLLESELAGVVRYTHYSFLVFGYGRIPIVSWLRSQADESMLHAQQIGEWIATLGEYPSLGIGPLLDSHQTDIGAMLRESLETERQALGLYRDLLDLVAGNSVALEEFARGMIMAEEMHAAEVDKMLRKPGDVAAFAASQSAARPGSSAHGR